MQLQLIVVSLTIVASLNLSTALAQQERRMIVTKPWARASILQSRPGVAYLIIHNKTSSSDRLIGVTSPLAREINIHISSETNGVMRMRSVPQLEIAAGQVVTMQPGGMHLMLTGLRQPLRQGEQLPIVLEFETAGQLHVNVPVLSIAAQGPKGE